jgi:hypothetical protein
MKNDRVREFEWLDTRSPEEDRYYRHNTEKPVLSKKNIEKKVMQKNY